MVERGEDVHLTDDAPECVLFEAQRLVHVFHSVQRAGVLFSYDAHFAEAAFADISDDFEMLEIHFVHFFAVVCQIGLVGTHV